MPFVQIGNPLQLSLEHDPSGRARGHGFSENRHPPRIKSGASLFGIMLQNHRPARTPLLPRLVSEGAATYHEFREAEARARPRIARHHPPLRTEPEVASTVTRVTLPSRASTVSM